MAKKTKKNPYREKKKQEGYFLRQHTLHKDVIAMIDKIDEETSMGKSKIVAEAVKDFAKSNYKKVTKTKTGVFSVELNTVKNTLNQLLDEYFFEYFECDEKAEDETVSNLKKYKKPYSVLRNEAFYNQFNKDHPDTFNSIRALRLFLKLKKSNFTQKSTE